MTDADRDPDPDSATDSGREHGDADTVRGETADWPVSLRGVTESVVTTLGPNDRWNCAALGLHAGRDGDENAARNGDAAAEADRTPTGDAHEGPGTDDGAGPDRPATARTWGRTRTRRNFRERGAGYVQFVNDPVMFTEAALSIREESSPVLDAAAAWVRVDVAEIDTGEDGGTEWVEWALFPRESMVRDRVVPTIHRGHGAVIEATVAASRLDVAAYDTDALCDRLSYLEGVVERCGGSREREAFRRLVEIVGRRW